MNKKTLLEQMLQIEERLETAIEVAKIGFYDWDISNNNVVFSDQMRIDWGYSLDEPLTDIESRIHIEDRSKTLLHIEDVLKSRVPYSTEYRVQRPDGEVIWIKSRGKVFYTEDGLPCRLFGTCVNITEQKHLELALEKSKLEADKANAHKSLFLAGIAHEIRNPLAGILGFTELLTEEKLTDERRHQIAKKIYRYGSGLLQILNDLLDLSKVEAGKLELDPLPLSLREIAAEANDLFTEIARKKSVLLSFSSDATVPDRIMSDPVRLRQVLTNLVSNAVKFTSFGKVEVLLSGTQIDASNWNFTFDVKDTGEGLTDLQREHLFKPFHQANASVQNKFGGTGLGLVLSRQIALALGGDLQIAETKPGQGSTFRFTFRSEILSEMNMSVESKTIADSKSPVETMFSNLKVLVADDSSDTRYLTSQLLTKSGAVVTIAKNGMEACELGLRGDFDFVLMDVEMPDMDGYEAARRLRSSGFKKPIIALSGHTQPGEKLKTLSAGCSAHLSKPLNPSELKECLSPHS
ncbi:MAG: response regulator [Bdellovibrionaceae bacterium]|nr:response regulator [Pseudobdellovibrionaceae bacterium]